MQLIDTKMINNTKQIAKNKLDKHRMEGQNSKLSIFEVANLLDMMKKAEELSHFSNEPSIFHSMAYN